MRGSQEIKMPRMEFITSSLLLVGTGFLSASNLFSQTAPRGPDLREELSPAEMEIANNSIMAKDMDNYWHKGYGCADSGLMVALRFMKKPEDLVWVAGGFVGGIFHQDLCGFLTAGILAIGLYAGSLKIENKEAKGFLSLKTNEYWSWWASTAPLHCRDIREGHKDFNVCHRLGKLSAAKLEDLLKA